jgi:hypothetical protein
MQAPGSQEEKAMPVARPGDNQGKSLTKAWDKAKEKDRLGCTRSAAVIIQKSSDTEPQMSMYRCRLSSFK